MELDMMTCSFKIFFKIRINVRIFIGIDRHWTMIEGVLLFIDCKCCGQLWVRHMFCGRTCDELYLFTFCTDRFGILRNRPYPPGQ